MNAVAKDQRALKKYRHTDEESAALRRAIAEHAEGVLPSQRSLAGVLIEGFVTVDDDPVSSILCDATSTLDFACSWLKEQDLPQECGYMLEMLWSLRARLSVAGELGRRLRRDERPPPSSSSACGRVETPLRAAVDEAIPNIEGIVESCREGLARAAAMYVFKAGKCGGDCTSKREATENVSADFNDAMASAVGDLQCLLGYLDPLRAKAEPPAECQREAAEEDLDESTEDDLDEAAEE